MIYYTIPAYFTNKHVFLANADGLVNWKINSFSFMNPKSTLTMTSFSFPLSLSLWSVFHYGVFYGPYFLVLSPNTGKYRPEKTPYFDTFSAVVSPIISHHLYFLRISKVWSKLHQGLVGQVQSKEWYHILPYTFLAFLFVKKLSFLPFSFLFFDEVSNFLNRMLTNLKPELVIRNCQWKCMSSYLSQLGKKRY